MLKGVTRQFPCAEGLTPELVDKEIINVCTGIRSAHSEPVGQSRNTRRLSEISGCGISEIMTLSCGRIGGKRSTLPKAWWSQN